MHDWKTIRIKKIKIYYLPELNGGGLSFGQSFIPVVKKLLGRVNRICEFGCGNGFIGFSLLAHGLCNELFLTDINPLALKACRKTIKENKLKKFVSVYLSDVLDDIPESEKWDLVVANPPHFSGSLTDYQRDPILIDPHWRIHQKFYRDVKQHLWEDGSIIFIENSEGSTAKLWKSIITKNKLRFVKTITSRQPLIKQLFYLFKLLYSDYSLSIWRYILFFWCNYKKSIRRIKLTNYPYYFVWSKR